jgi:hypothetical protein
MTSPDMISRRREAQFLRKTVQKPWRKTKRGLPSWTAALTAQMPTAFAEQLAAPAKNHRAEIQWKGEERYATKFLGERFRNHGGRPNGMTFMGRGTHSATARPTGRTICHEHLPTAGGQKPRRTVSKPWRTATRGNLHGPRHCATASILHGTTGRSGRGQPGGPPSTRSTSLFSQPDLRDWSVVCNMLIHHKKVPMHLKRSSTFQSTLKDFSAMGADHK